MDVASIATAMVAAALAQTQLAMAAKLAKMQAGNERSVVQLISAAQQNLSQLFGPRPEYRYQRLIISPIAAFTSLTASSLDHSAGPAR